MNRRGFLGTILAAAAAPAIVRPGSLMRIAPPREEFVATSIPFEIDMRPTLRTEELAMSLDEFCEKVMRPAMLALCERQERQFYNAILGVQ